MKKDYKAVYKNLDELLKRSPSQVLTENDRWVIFSDLHMGDGGTTDDFKSSAKLFVSALEAYYAKGNYRLLLNGDVEEMQRFSLKKIVRQWQGVYELFEWFHINTQLVKTVGNHDLELSLLEPDNQPYGLPVQDAFRLNYGEDTLFFFHGHQASKKFQKHNQLIGFTLKYFANPMGIKNYSVAHSSKKKYNIEKRAYHYSAYRKVVSVIGHTHRPLFESLHKVERIKYKIEQLCRNYVTSTGSRATEIANSIKFHKKELKKHHGQVQGTNYQSYVYNTVFNIPCLFNSGCVIGKRGMTSLEISGGKIRLVHWFDGSLSKKYLLKTGYQAEKLNGTDYYRMVINEESLNYIFTRIRFLT